jgi:hypothetical protein
MKKFRTIDLLNSIYNGKDFACEFKNVKSGEIIYQGTSKEDRLHFFRTNYTNEFYSAKIHYPVELEAWLKEEWVEVKKPVSFMEVLKSTKAVRVEHEFITNLAPSQSDEWFFKDLLDGNFFDIDNLIYYISEYADAEPLRDILLNGKWYIEED